MEDCAILLIFLLVVAAGMLLAYKCAEDIPRVIGGGGEALDKAQREVSRKYSRLRGRGSLKASKKAFKKTFDKTFEDICFPKKFEVTAPQKFVGEWLSPAGKHRELLAFHGIGSGKTCAAIQAIKGWLSRGKPLVVAPAALLPGFRAELRGPCAGDLFVDAHERGILENPTDPRYSKLLAEVNSRVDSAVTLMSYNGFLSAHRDGSLRRLRPPILVVDEVHNASNSRGNYNGALREFTRARPEMRVLVMTATPIYDHPEEIISLLGILRRDIPVEALESPARLRKATEGLISYYSGAPAFTYPQMTIKYDISVMSPFQRKWYQSQVERDLRGSGALVTRQVSDSFYCASRAKAICVFPNGLASDKGLAALKKRDLAADGPLKTYSCKVFGLIARLRRRKLSFVYSNFAGPNGVQFIVKALRANGWREYREPGKAPAFAVFSGEETPREKDAVRARFNSPENDGGRVIQVVIGSPAIKEGVSLLRVRQVHILDPYWNNSRTEQVFGRASRYCSHKSLPEEKRKVSVYLYVAVAMKAPTDARKVPSIKALMQIKDPRVSVDALILGMSEEKRLANQKIVEVLVGAAVDRGLTYSG